MNVASLELCKELHELSGWEDEHKWGWIAAHQDYEVDNGCTDGQPSAYTLGYLLRKLPRHLNERGFDLYGCLGDEPRWAARYQHFAQKPQMMYKVDAETPEDAVTKLAIELFKQNILTKET